MSLDVIACTILLKYVNGTFIMLHVILPTLCILFAQKVASNYDFFICCYLIDRHCSIILDNLNGKMTSVNRTEIGAKVIKFMEHDVVLGSV